MEQVRRGLITREQAEKSEMQNIIIRALGPEGAVEPDVDDQFARDGDLLMLATDGLTKNVPDEKMQAILQSAPTLDDACDQLIAAAKDAGGDDNVTCVLVRIVHQPWYKQLLSNVFSGGGSRKWQNSI
jgi:serine/threonine protein phosphatase PrpC